MIRTEILNHTCHFAHIQIMNFLMVSRARVPTSFVQDCSFYVYNLLPFIQAPFLSISGMEVDGRLMLAVWFAGSSIVSLAQGCIRQAMNNVADCAATGQQLLEDTRRPLQESIENVNRQIDTNGFLLMVLLILLCMLAYVYILRELEQIPHIGDILVPVYVIVVIFCLALPAVLSVYFYHTRMNRLQLHQHQNDVTRDYIVVGNNNVDNSIYDNIDTNNDNDNNETSNGAVSNNDGNHGGSSDDDDDDDEGGRDITEVFLYVVQFSWLPEFLNNVWDIIINRFLASIWNYFKEWIRKFSNIFMRNKILRRSFRD